MIGEGQHIAEAKSKNEIRIVDCIRIGRCSYTFSVICVKLKYKIYATDHNRKPSHVGDLSTYVANSTHACRIPFHAEDIARFESQTRNQPREDTKT